MVLWQLKNGPVEARELQTMSSQDTGSAPLPVTAFSLRPTARAATVAASCLALGWLGVLSAPAQDMNMMMKMGGGTPEQLSFFEQKIRPVLSEHCYKCHAQDSDKVRGGLLLDTRAALLKGGDTGPGLIPGDPDKSLLIKAVRYKDKDLQMPPNDRQLPANIIADLETWVKMGAPDPRTNAVVKGGKEYKVDVAQAKKHWSFQPVVKPTVPEPADPDHWVQTEVDKFILAAMTPKGLTPSRRTDKITLLRRATFDLIGLPPSPKEVEEFMADNSPDAFGKLVDRLLASPHYGERWGRHWLDVAHYGDTKGIQGNQRDDRYPYSFVYRDWVVKALNDDLPYDQFLLQQIAADKLPTAGDKHTWAAMGFLTLGNRMNDTIDDRLDIVGKGTMALSVVCARCHDHKFDPIPQKDYYALHGVFASSHEPGEEPLVELPANKALYQTFQSEFKARKAKIDTFRGESAAALKAEMLGKIATYMVTLVEFHRQTNNVSRDAFVTRHNLLPQVAAAWDDNLRNWQNNPNHPIFGPWFAFAKLPEASFAAKAPALAAKYFANSDKAHPVNPLIAKMFATAPTTLGQVAGRYSSVITDVETRWHEAIADWESKHRGVPNAPPTPPGLADAGQEEVRRMMYAGGSPLAVDGGRVNQYIDRDNKLRGKLGDLERSLEDLVISHPGSPLRAPALEDNGNPQNSAILIKGNSGNRGPTVERHFLSILAGDSPATFKNGSGRLELAQAIANKDNPLTARVMVNRVWLHHFNEGLVRSADDFGLRGDKPSHPELLDYLASRFVEEGWSIKQLHRWMMLSSVYQQSSEEVPRYEQIDPDNRWLWRMNRRRLDFEALRDTILAIGGDLDLTVGGRPVRLDSEPYSQRRTIYGFIDRKNVPSMFAAFDFANPDLTTGNRESTVVPQQALFMMNSQLVVEQARNVLRRVDVKARPDFESRLTLLYQLIYQRRPTDVEMNLARNFMKTSATTEWQTAPKEAWSYGYGNFDPATRRTKLFVPMVTYNNGNWQPDSRINDERLRGLYLGVNGGLPGRLFAVIRRWTAPRDGVLSIESSLTHNSKEGDGVHGRIVSSRLGELATANVQAGEAPFNLPRVQVKIGDTIDFMTDDRETPQGDYFTWPVKLHMLPGAGATAESISAWDSERDFSGEQTRRLNVWEKFAQVLMETNELTFVN